MVVQRYGSGLVGDPSHIILDKRALCLFYIRCQVDITGDKGNQKLDWNMFIYL